MGCYRAEAGSHPKFSLKELILADPVALIYPQIYLRFRCFLARIAELFERASEQSSCSVVTWAGVTLQGAVESPALQRGKDTTTV